jgi:hypothetical protein
VIEFKREEDGESFFKEAQELFVKHYEEIAERTDVIKFDPNVERYRELFKAGIIEIHTARDDGNLIGYNVWFVMNHLHYKSSLTATSDILYIAPEFRKGFTGVNFLRWTIDEIKKKKPQRILFHMKPQLDFGFILERFGAKYFEKTYSIVLE